MNIIRPQNCKHVLLYTPKLLCIQLINSHNKLYDFYLTGHVVNINQKIQTSNRNYTNNIKWIFHSTKIQQNMLSIVLSMFTLISCWI